MTNALKRLLLSALIVAVTLTSATLRAGQAIGSRAAAKPEGDTHVQPSQPPGEPAQNKAPRWLLNPFSPLDIELFIEGNPNADLKDLWRQLDIYPDYGDGEDRAATGNFLDSCFGCKAERFEYDLDEQPGKEVLLRIEDRLAESCRYLVFKRAPSTSSEGKWKLLGHIDWGSGKYRMPQHSVVVSGGKTWLLVEAADGSGSGYSHYSYRLFRVESTGVKELLDFPSEGYCSSILPFPVQDFSSRIVNCNGGGVTTVEVEFSVGYYSDFDTSKSGELLWAKKQRAIYSGDARKGKLTLDQSKSDLSEDEIADMYESEGISGESFIRYNFPQLAGMATGSDPKKKEWLRTFLDECRSTPEKAKLQKLLRIVTE